jgi:hypothetical protein
MVWFRRKGKSHGKIINPYWAVDWASAHDKWVAVGGSTALNNDSLGITMRGPHLVLTVGGLLSLIGLARLARHQARDCGRVNEAGAILASAGVVVIIASKNLPSGTPEETGWNVFYLGGLLLVIGSLLFGTVALRKSWLFGAPFLAMGVLSILNMVFLMGPFKVTGYEYVGTVLLPILIGFGWAVLGYALWSSEARASSVALREGI